VPSIPPSKEPCHEHRIFRRRYQDQYEGPESTNPLAFRHYDPDEMVMGKRMEDHLRFAVAYWHLRLGAATRSAGRPSSGRGSGDTMELAS
jgi:xylose isomerase